MDIRKKDETRYINLFGGLGIAIFKSLKNFKIRLIMKRRWKILSPNSTVKYDYAFPDKSFPLSVMRFSSFVPINLHRHDFHELVLVTSG